MDEKQRAACGTYCGICTWRESTGGKGCQECQSAVFWGTCDKAQCCFGKGYTHCGECAALPCDKLLALFADPDHGDKGARMRNLLNWKQGTMTYAPLR